MAIIQYKLVVEIDGKVAHTEEIGFEPLRDLASSWPDFKNAEVMFDYFSQSEHTELRRSIARSAHLGRAAIERLSQDRDVGVLENLLSQDGFEKWASTELLARYIGLSAELARLIAGSMEQFEEADARELQELLVSHPDPSVRGSLAANSNVPKRILKILERDRDPSVRYLAAGSLNR